MRVGRSVGILAVATMLVAAFSARAGTLPLTLLATASVDSASATPVIVQGLTPGLTYVLETTGTYRWGCEPQLPDCTNTFFADAECSEFGAADPAWRRYRFGIGYDPASSSWGVAPNGATSDPLDLKVDGFDVEWMPGTPLDSSPGLAACTDGVLALAGPHTYYAAYEATVPEIHLNVEDPIAGDNVGALTVQIYEPFSG